MDPDTQNIKVVKDIKDETLRQLSADGETGGVRLSKSPNVVRDQFKISGACC